MMMRHRITTSLEAAARCIAARPLRGDVCNEGVFFRGVGVLLELRHLRPENADAIGIEPVHTPSGLSGSWASRRAGQTRIQSVTR